MNRAAAFAEETMTGFIGRFRLDWRTEAFPVREKRDGPIVYFATAAEAECAAWRIKDKIERPHMLRHGAKAGRARCQAEALFGKVFVGKGKTVEVERRKTA